MLMCLLKGLQKTIKMVRRKRASFEESLERGFKCKTGTENSVPVPSGMTQVYKHY